MMTLRAKIEQAEAHFAETMRNAPDFTTNVSYGIYDVPLDEFREFANATSLPVEYEHKAKILRVFYYIKGTHGYMYISTKRVTLPNDIDISQYTEEVSHD